MPERKQTYLHQELTGLLLGAAMEVHRVLGPGFDESVYENALCLEFAARSIPFTQQERFPVFYKGRVVGTFITDLIADAKVVVETKVADSIHPKHIAQVVNYLGVTQLEVGMIFNFKNSSLEYKRIARTHPKTQSA